MSVRPHHGGDVWSNKVKADFSSNVNPLGPPVAVKKILKKALDDIHHYPDIDAIALKSAISKYVNTPTQNITLGNGSTELIKSFCEIFAKDENVVIPQPTFSEYGYFSKIYGAKIKSTPLDSNSIIDSIDSGTKAVFLCNPNNPTGTIFDRDEIVAVIKAAQKAKAHVLLDEAYIEFSEAKSFASHVQDFENLLVLRSLTKFFSLAGLRVGYACGSKVLVDKMERLRVPWNLNTLAQVAGVECLKDTGFIEASREFIKKEREFMFGRLSKFLKVKKTGANFFLIDLEGRTKSGELKRALLKKEILIRDASTFSTLDDNFIRVCIRTRDENVMLVEELERLL